MSFFTPAGAKIPGTNNFKTMTCETLRITNKISMDNGSITNLSEPTNASDAATKNYVDTHGGGGGGDLTGPISSTNGVTSITSQSGTGTTFVMNNTPLIRNINADNTIVTGVADPFDLTDAANKNYVDTHNNPNLSGPISALNGVTSITSQSGTGTTFVMNTTPILINPNIGNASGNSLETTGSITGNQLISTVATGTPPLVVASTTQVPGLKSAFSGVSDLTITNANLTGPIVSTGNTTAVASQTGTGSTFAMNTSPVFVTPYIENATGISLNMSSTITGNQLRSTVPIGTPPFMVTSTTQVPNLRSSFAGMSDSTITNANLTGPITSIGNTTSVASQTGSGSTIVMNMGPTVTNLNVGGTVISNVGTPVTGTDAANKNYVDMFTMVPEFTATVQKNPGPGEFGTIEEALASITTSSETEPWVVNVGPGVYEENQLVIPNYVSVKGSSINPTVVQPNVPNQYLFIMGTITELSFMTLRGIDGSLSPGPGAGFAAVYCTDVEDFAQVHKVSIYDFDIGIDNYANTTFSTLYVEYTDINGDYSYGTVNRSSSGFTASIVLEDYFSYTSESTTKTAILNDGVGSTLQITGSTLIGGPGMTGIVAKNGGELFIGAVLLKDFSLGGSLGGIISQNVGAGAVFKIDGTTFDNCVPDFSINNVGTSGYFFGNSPRNNHFVADGSAFIIAGQDNNLINVAKKGGDYTSIKIAVDSITNASPTNIYIIKIGPGIFVENTITMKQGVFLVGYYLNATTIVPSDPNSTVINLTDISYIKDIYITGATGVNGIAVNFQGTNGLGTLVRDCAFGNNTTNVNIFGSSALTLIVIDRCSIIGNCTECIVVTNNPGVQTRVTINNVFYRDLVLPVCTNFFRASGVGVSVNVLGSLMLVASVPGTKAFLINDGVDFRITGSSITGFDDAIYIPTGSPSSCSVNGSGVIINNSGVYDIFIGSDNTIGSWLGETTYTKVHIPTASLFFMSATDLTIISVQKSGGDFLSIVAALASITDNTSIKRYVINVGAGTFTEGEIIMKQYVSIRGAGRSTVISPNTNMHHAIRGCDYAELDSFIVSGTGSGYAAIYQETPLGVANSALICRNILFGINDIHVWSYGNVGQAHVILFSCRYGGTAPFNYGFRATNNSNTMASKITIMGTTSQDFASPMPLYVVYASGTNCTVSVNSFSAIHNGSVEAGTVCFRVDNGALLRLISCTVRGFDTAIYAVNAGAGPQVVSAGFTITDCTTDVNIQHPDTTGSLDVSASRTKTIINGMPPMSLFLVDPVEAGVAFSGPFYYSKTNFNGTTNIANLIIDTPSMGIISGGILSAGSGLTLAVSSGNGYNKTAGVDDVLKFQMWTDGNLLLAANSNVYIVVNTNGLLASSPSYPDTTRNILLGLVSTNSTDIIYIQQIPLNARHWSNNADSTLRNALGPIFSSGSSVVEVSTRQLQVSQGIYYFSACQFLPGGGNPVTFNIFYRSGTPGIFTSVVSQTTVPNTSYDDGSGTLVPLTAGFCTKHLLLLLGGPSETYALVYGQDQYSTQGAAEAAGLPIMPSFVTDSFVRVASIVVEQGTPNLVAIVDERPRIGFASSSTTGVITVHGDLSGLSANDHPQYLLVNGGSPGMLGSLNMNGNQILTAGLINSIDISAHGLRHGLNSSDPLPTPIVSGDISSVSDTASALGNSNDIPRADHVHFHGNLGGGNLHAAAVAGGVSGFMTGSDKTKLDGIAPNATNTAVGSSNPVNVSKSAASPGIATDVSRSDHKHDISTASPVTTILTSTPNAEGTATTLSRSDHTHAISSDVPVILTPDESIAIGNSTAFARADHIHTIPTAIASSLNANSTNAQGAASSFSRSNHTHSIASGPPSNQTIAASVGTGTSANFARADHTHTFSTGVPVSVGAANSEGTSVSFSRLDHVHSHGNQPLGDGLNHAVVVAAGASGFMSGSDKTKLDGIAPGATDTQLSDVPPENVDTGVAVAGISLEVSRADHKHDISTATAVSLSATTVNSEGISTSVSRADHTHTVASGPPSNQTIATLVATGSSANFARADHIHTFSTGVPNSIGSTNTEGTSTSFSRADHVHSVTLTGPITSVGTLTSVSSQTGTGSTFVMNNSPTLITPIIGAATGSSLSVSGSVRTGTSIIIEDPGAGTNTVTLQAPTLSTGYSLTLPVDDGLPGQLLTTDGNGVLDWVNTGINVVSNVGTSTDTAIARFSGTTGKIIQNSPVLVSGAGAISGVGTINMSGQLTSTLATGTAPFVVSSTTQVANLTSTNSINSTNSTNSANSTISDDTTTNAVVFPTWVSASSGNLPQKVSSTKLSFNPSTGVLTSTGFSGLLSNSTGLPLSTGIIGILPAANGGTGINNGGNTLTLGGNLVMSGAFASTFIVSATTSVTLPTSGTLATTNQLPTPAALTSNNDTNVTLTLGGTPATSLLQPASISAGWTGVLSLLRGGLGASLVASNGGIFYSTGTTGAILSGTSTTSQVLLSGSSSAPNWSSATYPSTTSINQLLYSSANNVLTGLATLANAALLTTAGGLPNWVAYTGTGAPVLANSPDLVTPDIGAATGTSLNVSGSVVCGNIVPRAVAFEFITITTISTATSPTTLTAAQIIGGYINLSYSGSIAVLSTPTAAAIIAAVPNAVVGTSFTCSFRKCNTTAQTALTLGTGVTVLPAITPANNLFVNTGSVRSFVFQITNIGTPAVTMIPMGATSY